MRGRAAAPVALLAGGIVFLVTSGLGRATSFGPDFARSSRYVYFVAALVLPALAVAAEAVGQRWRILAPVVVVLLLIGIPGNLDVLADYQPLRQANPLPSLAQSNRRANATGCEMAPVARRLDKGHSLRIDGGRVLLRYSGTEPKARLLLEGRDAPTLEKWSKAISDAIRKQVGA